MNERIVAVVPIRSLRDGKTRLAPVLSPQAREALSRRLLAGTIAAVREAGAVGNLLVVSPDPAARDVARWVDPRVVALAQDRTEPGLNGAIRQARAFAVASGAAALLVVFGDLPLLTAADVACLAASPDRVTIARDRHGAGTNALLLRLDGPDRALAFAFAFGEGSAARHAAEAARLGLSPAWFDRPGTAFDLDDPDDWELLRLREPGFLDLPDAAPVLVAGEEASR